MSVYICNQCGFQVPAGDHVGVAVMEAHLAEHDRCPVVSHSDPEDDR